MKTHMNASALTEKELRDEIRELRLRAQQGELTAISANRLSELEAALRQIQSAKHGRW